MGRSRRLKSTKSIVYEVSNTSLEFPIALNRIRVYPKTLVYRTINNRCTYVIPKDFHRWHGPEAVNEFSNKVLIVPPFY